MNYAFTQRLVNAVLYEGYLLYPYRASAVKNRHRWTFGALYPPAYCSMNRGNEVSSMQVECLVQDATGVRLEATLRFLHLISCESKEGSVQQAVERATHLRRFSLREMTRENKTFPFDFPASLKTDDSGSLQQESICGTLTVSAKQLDAHLYKFTLRAFNETSFEEAPEPTRDQALLRSLVSTHIVLHVKNGEFISLLDPPENLSEFAAGCKNAGWWPVLIGEEGERDAMLASPIILYDYPQIAPESPGDLFDSTEIDEILTLRILTLTDEEKREMRQVDERARKLLERTEALPPEQFMKLHGAVRGLKKVTEETQPVSLWNPWESKPGPESALVCGVQIRKGDRVRLRPLKNADILDLALNGKTAIVEAIEEDYDGRVHLAVVIEEDPGKDLGELRQPGHRFFFAPEEVEPL